MAQFPRLSNSTEFRTVYSQGKRHNGSLMAAFVLSNDLGKHRLGITASRKVARRAVDRNRAKRLLREAFRLSGDDLITLKLTYDWVLNAKTPLLGAGAESAVFELRRIIRQVRIEEARTSAAQSRI